MLLERPGEIVTREEMRKRLWPSDTFVDFEHSMNSAIKKLRAALSDSPENSRYIETIPRVGYRFIAPVVRLATSAPPDVSVVNDRAAVSTPSIATTVRARWQVYLGIAVVLLALPGAYFALSRFRARPPQGKIAEETHGAASGANSASSKNQPAVSSKSPEANDLYLKGMYFWNKRTVAAFQQAIEYFQQATAKDPSYAPAYAGLANSYTLLSAYSAASATLYVPQARAAARKALDLDPNLAEAHTALALIVQNHDWDWKTSEKEFRRAIDLNPNYATAHHWYAEHLMWLGRFDEALGESERAMQLDPLSLIIAADHGAILYNSRQYDRAIKHLRTVLRKDPNWSRAGVLLLDSYVQKRMFAQALAQPEELHRLYGEGPGYWAFLAYIYGQEGQLERARNEMGKVERLSRHEEVNPALMLRGHLGVGDKEEALADLEKLYAQHQNGMTALGVDPVLDPLRGDPRFQDLLRRVGLSDAASTR